MGRIIIVSGPPGAGKTTVSHWLSWRAPTPLSMHMTTDDVYGYLRKGALQPWLPEANAQNTTLIGAMASAAALLARGGYWVVVDGVVGAWFLEPWTMEAAAHGVALDYVVLMPSEAATVARATARTGPRAMTNPQVARGMWRRFDAAATPDGCRIDTTTQTPDETVAVILDGLAAGRFRVAPA